MTVLISINADDLRTVLGQRTGHSHRVPGLWDSTGLPCAECAARARLQAAVATAPSLTSEGGADHG